MRVFATRCMEGVFLSFILFFCCLVGICGGLFGSVVSSDMAFWRLEDRFVSILMLI